MAAEREVDHMETYTPVFEAWWNANAVAALRVALLTDAQLETAKTVCWDTWKLRREKLYEELSHLRVQPPRAA